MHDHRSSLVLPMGFIGASGDGPPIGFYVVCKAPDCMFIRTTKTRDGVNGIKQEMAQHLDEVDVESWSTGEGSGNSLRSSMPRSARYVSWKN